MSVGANNSSGKKSSSKIQQFVEPTIKLNNFVASDYKPSKFTSQKQQPRKESEVSEEEYEEDFESMSKSHVSTGKVQIKKNLMVADSTESYSNEQFESLAESKTLSNEDKIKCFVCK